MDMSEIDVQSPFRTEAVLKSLLHLSRVGAIGSSAVSTVTHPEQLAIVLRDLALTTSREFLSALPKGPYPQQYFDRARALDLAVISRVPTVRLLYATQTAHDPENGETLCAYADAGADVRVASHVPERMIIADRACAVVPLVSEFEGRGALVVREPTIVKNLFRLYWSQFRTAVPVQRFIAGVPAQSEPGDRLLLLVLKSGVRDQAAAEQLGVSLRTLRRHVADLMDRLGATTRFQAAILAAERGWI